MVKDVTLEYVAAGGNRHPAAADWGVQSGRLLAFGADRNIALWSPLTPKRRGIRWLLSGHTETVNVVKFLTIDNHTILISGSADKTICLWTPLAEDAGYFRIIATLRGHSASINAIAVLPGSDLFVSGAADATARIWKILKSEDGSIRGAELKQRIDIKPRFFPLALSLSLLPKSSDSYCLAVGGTKSTVQIYVADGAESALDFRIKATLTGHEGWIRSLAFTQESDNSSGDLLLASASQDKYIRLWRIRQGEELPAASTANSDPSLGSFGKSLSNKAHRFSANRLPYSATFEALLLGHEDWIYTIAWKTRNGVLQLLSASADNSLTIWESDSSSGIWVSTARIGEISAQKGSTTATGSTGGFWIGLWSSDGEAVVSLGRTGGWRIWTYDREQGQWIQGIGVSGHVKSVMGVTWAKDGSYLLSTGSDQTTRLHAPWKHQGVTSWHEFSRPQIHGYDLNCIDSIGHSQFISGADEKLLRVFDEPQTVARLLQTVCGIKAPKENLPNAANMPVLGLSNKAIDAEIEDETDSKDASAEIAQPPPSSTLQHTSHPPSEDLLSRHTLWPETEKLYGHGYEISAVSASHSGQLVATACRASSLDHAVIRLYDATSWRELAAPLRAHALTVTRLRFSPDDYFLLSVGRDRQWALFERQDGVSEPPPPPLGYALVHADPKGHARMILDAAWAPLEAGCVFATAGRDKLVKVWVDQTLQTTVTAECAVTAVAFAPRLVDGVPVLAMGLEDGRVKICILQPEGAVAYQMEASMMPSKAITELAWRPIVQTGEGTNGESVSTNRSYDLAVASEDSSLRIFSVAF